jgi:hypothetical protein
MLNERGVSDRPERIASFALPQFSTLLSHAAPAFEPLCIRIVLSSIRPVYHAEERFNDSIATLCTRGLLPKRDRSQVMRAANRVASSPSEFKADTAPINAALDRLYGAPLSQVDEIVSGLDESARAAIAVFCNARAHLNGIGLAIAAKCSVDHLAAAAGSKVADARLFEQARKLAQAGPRSNWARRPITLARV